MASAGAIDKSAGASRQQFCDGIRPSFDICVKRPDRAFMQTVKLSVITHYIQILVGNSLLFNAGIDAWKH
ncbi:MAG TPA: hypothetical protein VGI90_07295 [Steroidobacteraceae bacterium]|jgi:hypothetical protein